ncbi:hypothetical protein N9137_01070 [Pseudomonadales bacterium]|nr:hypothetical protein [Pseudomonadales bacterium]
MALNQFNLGMYSSPDDFKNIKKKDTVFIHPSTDNKDPQPVGIVTNATKVEDGGTFTVYIPIFDRDVTIEIAKIDQTTALRIVANCKHRSISDYKFEHLDYLGIAIAGYDE